MRRGNDLIACDSLTFILVFSALVAAILASHAILAFGSAGLRRIFAPIGILSHLAMLILFLFTENSRGKALELELVVLFFAASTLVYTALYYIAERVAARKTEESEAVADDL